MNTYEERKARKIAGLKIRAERNREIAANNGMDLLSEEKSGIPFGQPILVGHHSEKRHRKHVERIHNKIRKGFEAAEKANQYDRAIQAIEARESIDSDNPEAVSLVEQRIEKLNAQRLKNRRFNILLRKAASPLALAGLIEDEFPDIDTPEMLAKSLWGDDPDKKKGIPHWWFSNIGSQITRLRKRLDDLKRMESSNFSVKDHERAKVWLENGRVILKFTEIPSEEVRDKLKCSPLAFRWSPSKKFWCRKHTPTTNSRYFKTELESFIKEYINGK